MTVEIKAVSTTVSTSVSKLWQKPLKIIASSNIINVYPPEALLQVTSGDIKSKGVLEIKNWGYIVRFSNSLTAQAETIEGGLGNNYDIIMGPFAIASAAGASAAVKISFDSTTGTFIASRPCYAAIRVKPHMYKIATYDYTPGQNKFGNGVVATYGMAYAIIKSPDPMTPHQITTFDIPAPQIDQSDPGLFERYRVKVDTVLTPTGEWHKPENFDKDDYDPDNAYGEGKEGPSKDEGYVIKEHPLEVGHVDKKGEFNFQKSPVPNIRGTAGKNVNMVDAPRPPELPIPTDTKVPDAYKLSASDVQDRVAAWTNAGWNLVDPDPITPA